MMQMPKKSAYMDIPAPMGKLHMTCQQPLSDSGTLSTLLMPSLCRTMATEVETRIACTQYLGSFSGSDVPCVRLATPVYSVRG